MLTLVDLLQALFFVAIPVGIFSFLMVYFSYQKGYLSTDFEIQEAFNKQNKQQTSFSKKNKKNLQFLHSKWVTFGGGFYGLIALLTFIIIELTQVVNFLFNLTGWHDIVALFSFNTLISMIIDSIVNMVSAAIWFTYWADEFKTDNFIVWILIAYIAYRFGAKSAMRYAIEQDKDTQEMLK
ncbi:hypothetical protein AADZ91_10050 [Colwelliaceae bacterium 6441]